MTDPAEADREQRGYAAGSALELVSHAYMALEVDVSDSIEEFDLDYALDVKGYLQAVRRAASEIEKQVDTYVAAQLQPATYYRHRDSIIRPGGSGSWKVSNGNALVGWLGDDLPKVLNPAASGAFTKTRIEALAKEREEWTRMNNGRDSDHATPEQLKRAAQTAVDTFFSYERREGAITVLRLEDAPKKAQKLAHGEAIGAPQKQVK